MSSSCQAGDRGKSERDPFKIANDKLSLKVWQSLERLSLARISRYHSASEVRQLEEDGALIELFNQQQQQQQIRP